MAETSVQTEHKTVASIKALLGQKIGMTQIFDAQGGVTPVTVILAGPCHVTQIISPERNGYSAIQVAFGEVREKSLNKPFAGQFKKAQVSPARWIREFRTDKAADFQVGQVINASVFAPGDYVDVIGISKGKGFAGSMKRHNFSGGPSTHGQSDRARAPGSSGSNTYPGRVFKGKKFPGHLGVEQTTVQHLEVVNVDPERNLLMIRGAVPGNIESLVTIQQTIKRVKVRTVHAAPSGKKAKKEAAPVKATKPAAPAAKAGK
jgi:large subunit ribosomal protein L3